MICDHNWEVQESEYEPPIKGINPKGLASFNRRATEGITHILLKCSLCGHVKEDFFYGKDRVSN